MRAFIAIMFGRKLSRFFAVTSKMQHATTRLKTEFSRLCLSTRWRMAVSGACLLSLCVGAYILFPELYLATWTFEQTERYWESNPRTTEAIVSLTTLPHRVGGLATVLKSILLQSARVKRIHLYIPEKAARDDAEYDIPKYLRYSHAVKIVRTPKDWGPSTKFIPAVLTELSNQMIIAIDDDVVYPNTLVEHLTSFSSQVPDAALATRGWNVPKSHLWAESGTLFGYQLSTLTSVDIITGAGGYLLKPRFFDLDQLTDYKSAPAAAFFVDDIWVSGMLSRHKTRKFLIPTNARQTAQFLRNDANRGLINSVNKGGRNNDIMLEFFGKTGDWQYELAQ